MKMIIADYEIDVTFSPDGMLAWPTEWTDELESRGFLDAAATILTLLPQLAVQTPWFIGSASKSIAGKDRLESKSHMSGQAFDMSPMYSKDQVLSPDGSIMGLAWNVMSLAMLVPAYEGYPHFVVEGDHIHVQPMASLPPKLMACFTMPTWYEWTQSVLASDDERTLANTFWIFDPELGRMQLAPADAITDYLTALQV